jgi:hypothetical protein
LRDEAGGAGQGRGRYSTAGLLYSKVLYCRMGCRDWWTGKRSTVV